MYYFELGIYVLLSGLLFSNLSREIVRSRMEDIAVMLCCQLTVILFASIFYTIRVNPAVFIYFIASLLLFLIL